MSNAPNLLNDDGTASIATTLMMSHHAFRRDIARFAIALEKVARGDLSKVEDLREEWQKYHETLHGHHESEDARIFPHVKSQRELMGPIIEQLMEDHRRIDPLLERGDRAFAALPNTEVAILVITQLTGMLEAHLASEEFTVIPFLRDAKDFPPLDDADANLYAHGFAWSSQGIAPDILTQVDALLPENLKSRIPDAKATFDARCVRVWGSATAGSSRTPVPDR